MFSLNRGELFFVLQVTEETKTSKRRHINSSGNCSDLVHSKKETPTEKGFSTEIVFLWTDFIIIKLIILIKSCKIPCKNLDKTLLFLRNQVFCQKNLKTLSSSNYPAVQYFLLKIRTCFLLTIV